MANIKKVISGEDLINLKNNSDVHNLTNIKLSNLDEDDLYLVNEHIGFYEPKNRSGIFILKIDKITDKLIDSMLC